MWSSYDALLEDEQINVWAKPTYLPEELMKAYDGYWTMNKLEPILTKAAEKGVAIEIDNALQIPSIEVIKMAKEKGCKFSFANISSLADIEKSTYFLEVIEACQLTYLDFYIPGWEGIELTEAIAEK